MNILPMSIDTRFRPYWFLLVLIAVGVPGFLQFDTSGLSRAHGLFNAQSISRILLTLGVGFAFTIIVLHRGIPVVRRHSKSLHIFFGLRLPLIIITLYTLSSFINLSGTDLYLALYRITEWALAIVLVGIALPAVSAEGEFWNARSLKTIKTVCILPIAAVLIGAIIAPNLAFTGLGTGFPRLGGFIYNSLNIGALASLLCVYFLTLDAGRKARTYAFLALIVVGMTVSRQAFILLPVVFLCSYLLVSIQRGNIIRLVFGVLLIIVLMVFLLLFSEAVLTTFLRGSTLESLLTINNRTLVWGNAWDNISESPWIGQGYIIGPKQFGQSILFVTQHWLANHTHNEFLNAGISGGMIAATLTFFLHLRLIFAAVFSQWSRKEKIFLVFVSVYLFFWAFLGTSLSYVMTTPGVILLIISRILAIEKLTR